MIEQYVWAVTDPNWGEPKIITQSVADTRSAAVDAFLNMPSYGLYTGASQWPMPNGTRGDMEIAEKYGFRVVKIDLSTATVSLAE